MLDPSRYFFLLFFFLRPWILIGALSFVAGGVATLEYDVVKQPMTTAQYWYQKVLKPPLELMQENARKALNENH